MFVPALAGAGAPHWAPEARGAFLGLTTGHSEADLIQAMLEGVAFECFWMVEAFRECGIVAGELRVSGGGARSRIWPQLLADVLGLPVAVANDADAGLRGAAAYASSPLAKRVM
jgi:xylulokinase